MQVIKILLDYGALPKSVLFLGLLIGHALSKELLNYGNFFGCGPMYIETIEHFFKAGIDVNDPIYAYDPADSDEDIVTTPIRYVIETINHKKHLINTESLLSRCKPFIELFCEYGAQIPEETVKSEKEKATPLLNFIHEQEIKQLEIKHKKEIQRLREEIYAPGGEGYLVA